MSDVDKLDIDLDDLTIDEIDAIEEITACPFDKVLSGEGKRAPMLRALAFVVMRRTNPEVTLEEVGRLRISAFGGGRTDPPETSAPSPLA